MFHASTGTALMTQHFVMAADAPRNVLAWRVLGPIYIRDIPAIVESVQAGVGSLKQPVKLLVDNRSMLMNGRPIIFTPDVNAEWIKLQEWLLPRSSHVAVLCNGSVMKLQMDRLAKTSGLAAVLRSFWDPDPMVSRDEAYAFLKINRNPLVDRISKTASA
jgi:hypothetical protein